MEFGALLGFLGLLGIVVLIIIYILRPNYQQKYISSTYVWKLSLRYRKKKIPISKLRNIIIILCQILIITICAFIFAQPFIAGAVITTKDEKILIIDASASMLGFDEAGVTRFKRAVEAARTEGHKTIEKKGLITVILAGKKADIITMSINSSDLLDYDLNELIISNNFGNPKACTFGDADIDGAMDLAEKRLALNPKADVLFFTATQFAVTGKVKVIDISARNEKNDPLEWNAAILNVTPFTDGYLNDEGEWVSENWCIFEVEVASYGRDFEVDVNLEIHGASGLIGTRPFENRKIEMTETVVCSNGESSLIYFDAGVYSYESVRVRLVDVKDSFSYDNEFWHYGGTKGTVRVNYVSQYPADYSINPNLQNMPGHNVFVNGILNAIRIQYEHLWNMEIKRTTMKDFVAGDCDFYIFEHMVPDIIPLDGVVFIIDPDNIPDNLGFEFGDRLSAKPQDGIDYFEFFPGQSHPIMNNVDARNIRITEYRSVSKKQATQAGFDSLMYVGGEGNDAEDADSAFLVKNTPKEKIAVLPFSLNMSTLPVNILDWAALMTNIFKYFFPPTLEGYVFDVGESINLNTRGSTLKLKNPRSEVLNVYDSFPQKFSAPEPGIYELEQVLLDGITIFDYFFAKISTAQSDFRKVVPELKNPVFTPEPLPDNMDLLRWFALSLVSLLFIEYFLHILEKN